MSARGMPEEGPRDVIHLLAGERTRYRWVASPNELDLRRSASPMNIIVLVKQVPDTWAERRLNDSDKTLDRASVDAVINELDEYAVEEALRLKEAHGGTVTVLTMGPARATETIRKALSMGADKGIHVTDEALHGSDALQTARALAKALGTVEWDLVIAGSESTDARMSV